MLGTRRFTLVSVFQVHAYAAAACELTTFPSVVPDVQEKLCCLTLQSPWIARYAQDGGIAQALISARSFTISHQRMIEIRRGQRDTISVHSRIQTYGRRTLLQNV